VQTVQSGPSAARLRGIRAESAPGAPGWASHNPPVVGSSPTRPTCDFTRIPGLLVDRVVNVRLTPQAGTHRATAERVLACQGIRRNRPLAGRVIRFRRTCKTEQAAQIGLGKLLEGAPVAVKQPNAVIWTAGGGARRVFLAP
jgi:hypothetical protein